MSNNTPNNNLRRYEILVNIWKRWDESYWTSFYIFILIIGLLFAGFAHIYDKTKLLALILCLAGILISSIWLFILHKKLTHIYLAEKEGRKLEKIIFDNESNQGLPLGCFQAIMNPDKNFLSERFKSRFFLTKIPSGILVAFVIPFIFIAI
ncbi:MAG: hypothetical protein JSW06_00630 [Thermoplasmatales archaeon]|nr:MAG: hypothetical protein JSW06_00630 [Thermoplasmatales archaeon]